MANKIIITFATLAALSLAACQTTRVPASQQEILGTYTEYPFGITRYAGLTITFQEDTANFDYWSDALDFERNSSTSYTYDRGVVNFADQAAKPYFILQRGKMMYLLSEEAYQRKRRAEWKTRNDVFARELSH